VLPAIVLLLFLTGCTPNPPAPLPKVNTMTPDEAVAQQIVPLAEAAGKEIGGKWEPDGTLTPFAVGQTGDDCTMPNGEPGISYTIVWRGPGVADVDAVAAKIQAAWKKLGTDVPVVTDNSMFGVGEGRVLSDPPYLTGVYKDEYIVQLTIGTKSTFMIGTTHCVPDPTEPSAE